MKAAQHGFALIAAIVLVAVLAALAGFVASMVGGQGSAAQLERMSQVVERAAQTGVEMGGYRVMRGPAAVCPASTILPAVPAYPGVRVAVSCTSTATSEPLVPGPGTVTVYQVTATATYGSAPANADYVERGRMAIYSR